MWPMSHPGSALRPRGRSVGCAAPRWVWGSACGAGDARCGGTSASPLPRSLAHPGAGPPVAMAATSPCDGQRCHGNRSPLRELHCRSSRSPPPPTPPRQGRTGARGGGRAATCGCRTRAGLPTTPALSLQEGRRGLRGAPRPRDGLRVGFWCRHGAGSRERGVGPRLLVRVARVPAGRRRPPLDVGAGRAAPCFVPARVAPRPHGPARTPIAVQSGAAGRPAHRGGPLPARPRRIFAPGAAVPQRPLRAGAFVASLGAFALQAGKRIGRCGSSRTSPRRVRPMAARCPSLPRTAPTPVRPERRWRGMRGCAASG